MAKKNRSILLSRNVYGRAKAKIVAIAKNKLASAAGMELVVAAIYKRDPIYVSFKVFEDLINVTTYTRSDDRDFEEYEAEFSARVARLAAHGSCATSSYAIIGFLILHNANVSSSQRISVLVAAAPPASERFSFEYAQY